MAILGNTTVENLKVYSNVELKGDTNRISAPGKSLYLGNPDDAEYIYSQKIASATGENFWNIQTNGDARFKTIDASLFSGPSTKIRDTKDNSIQWSIKYDTTTSAQQANSNPNYLVFFNSSTKTLEATSTSKLEVFRADKVKNSLVIKSGDNTWTYDGSTPIEAVIPQGPKGDRGYSISKVSQKSKSGKTATIAVYSNETSSGKEIGTFTVTDGADSTVAGPEGRGISSISCTNNQGSHASQTLTVNYTKGTPNQSFTFYNGTDGKDGTALYVSTRHPFHKKGNELSSFSIPEYDKNKHLVNVYKNGFYLDPESEYTLESNGKISGGVITSSANDVYDIVVDELTSSVTPVDHVTKTECASYFNDAISKSIKYNVSTTPTDPDQPATASVKMTGTSLKQFEFTFGIPRGKGIDGALVCKTSYTASQCVGWCTGVNGNWNSSYWQTDYPDLWKNGNILIVAFPASDTLDVYVSVQKVTNAGSRQLTSFGYWIEKRGKTGSQGPQGIQGIQGPRGIQGIQGPIGPEPANCVKHNGSNVITGYTVYGAVANDYADAIEVNNECNLEPGYCYCFDGNQYYKSSRYLDDCIIGIHSDTYGMSVGKKVEGRKELDVAVSGFALAYVDKIYKPGTPLTCTKDGYLTEISLQDKRDYPEKIVGIFWKEEKEDIWEPETKNIKVNGRHWIKVR